MKASTVSLLSVVVLLVGAAGFAQNENANAAVVIRLDEGCGWGQNGFGDYFAEGDVDYVETQNGKWKLACHGEIVGDVPERAVQLRSTEENPLGVCITPFGETFDWHTVFSPSGRSSISCHGDLTP